MALSKEVKDALSDHYRNNDLYDPSKAPEQEVMTFKPKGLCMGGSAGSAMGYDEGGDVLAGMNPGAPDGSGDDFSGPSISGDTDTARGASPSPIEAALVNKISIPPDEPAPVVPAPAPAQMPVRTAPATQQAALPLPGSMPPISAPNAAPVGAGGMAPDEYAQLVAALSKKPSFGQSAMSGLAGLADAIETGVARAGNPGFQKGIDERNQSQRANLIEALRGKYEAGFKGKELGQAGQRIAEEGRHNLENEKETRAARLLTQQQQDLALRNAKVQQGMEAERLGEEKNKNEMEQAQKGSGLINAVERKLGFGPPLPGAAGAASKAPVPIKTHSDYLRLPAGTHYVDSKGKEGVKK